ncbi:MAG: purine-nucleoside phosphorylase [Oscillospiraceae bacterium]|jgi:purine-nucleoside phosphorylase|nr:purine-nucleoside phosphorylase [Oscillospiraceae bacterium]
MQDKIRAAAAAVRAKTDIVPTVGVVLGSGLGGLADSVEKPCVLPYCQLPGFVPSTAPGHAGQLLLGKIGAVPVVCMQGRLHYYEGYTMENIVFPVRVMKALGIKTLILTNASGGVNLNFQAGDLMLLTDHINFLGTNPLIGPNDEKIGPRFPDMSHIYTPALQKLALKAADVCGIPLKQGVYLATTGPSYETPAEIRMFRTLGADAVGMSTVPEAIAAAHCGLQVLGFSMITNMAAGVLDQPLSSDEVICTANARGHDLQRLIAALLPMLP